MHRERTALASDQRAVRRPRFAGDHQCARAVVRKTAGEQVQRIGDHAHGRKNETTSRRKSQATPTIARASCSMRSSCQSQPAAAGFGHGSSRGANYAGILRLAGGYPPIVRWVRVCGIERSIKTPAGPISSMPGSIITTGTALIRAWEARHPRPDAKRPATTS